MVDTVEFVNDLNVVQMKTGKEKGNYLRNRVRMWWNGSRYMTANEYFSEAKVWKRIDSGILKDDHLKHEVMRMVKEYKKISKTAQINKWIAAAMYFIMKRDNLIIDK